MTKGDRPEDRGAWALLVLMLLAAWMLFAIQACSPKIVERIDVRHDTTYVHYVQVDSIFRRDSVIIRERGDTVYYYRERIRDRYKFVHDTLRLVKVDSVAVERVKEVEVEKPLPIGQSLKIRAFWWLFVAALLLGLWAFRKPILAIIKNLLKL